jgi:hypothetical protein
LKPVIAAALVLLLGYGATAIYLSTRNAGADTENKVEAAQPASTEASPAADQEMIPGGSGESVVVAQRSQPKTSKPAPSPAVKKEEAEAPADAAPQPEPERPRIVKTPAKPRNRQAADDQGYVSDIESIFTGGPPPSRRDQMSDEEKARRKRIRQLRREGKLPPF